MKRVVTAAALATLLVLASTATAGTIWDYTSQYSTTSNTSSDVWQRGYLVGAGGSFVLYEDFRDTTATGTTLVRWEQDEPDACGNAVKNTGEAYENWAMYWEPGMTTLMPGQNGAWVAARWTAPASGDYLINARWTNQRTGGMSVDVGARYGEEYGTTLFSETLNGFVGRGVNGFTDATGTNPDATYSNTLTLAAGRAIDFTVAAGFDYNTTGLVVTITAVPEASSCIMLASGILGLLAYAWQAQVDGSVGWRMVDDVKSRHHPLFQQYSSCGAMPRLR